MPATACGRGPTHAHRAISNTSVCLKVFKTKGHREPSRTHRKTSQTRLGHQWALLNIAGRRDTTWHSRPLKPEQGPLLPAGGEAGPAPSRGRIARHSPRRQPRAPSAQAARARCAPLTACASPAAGGQPAVTSMPCSLCVCFSWLSEGFSWAAPTVLLVHSSTSLCRSSVKVPVLLLLLFVWAWTCRVGWGPGSGPGTRLLVEDPGEAHTGRVGDCTQRRRPAAGIRTVVLLRPGNTLLQEMVCIWGPACQLQTLWNLSTGRKD